MEQSQCFQSSNYYARTVFAYNEEGCSFIILPGSAYCEHFLNHHTDLNIDIDSLLSLIIYVQKNS